MTFGEYQDSIKEFALYPAVGAHKWVYPALGLSSEAGEVLGKLKKIIRDKDGKIGPEERSALMAELGDVVWYLCQLATELDISMDLAAAANLRKLSDRKQRGVIQGSGDNR